MTETELITDALAALCARAEVSPDDGSLPARDAVRAVVQRDRVTGDDRWQGWFRDATGLPVLVSTEFVILLRDRAVVARVALPRAVQVAVREACDGRQPQGGQAGRRLNPVLRVVMLPCRVCRVPRPVANHPGNVQRSARTRCRACVKNRRVA